MMQPVQFVVTEEVSDDLPELIATLSPDSAVHEFLTNVLYALKSRRNFDTGNSIVSVAAKNT